MLKEKQISLVKLTFFLKERFVLICVNLCQRFIFYFLVNAKSTAKCSCECRYDTRNEQNRGNHAEKRSYGFFAHTSSIINFIAFKCSIPVAARCVSGLGIVKDYVDTHLVRLD